MHIWPISLHILGCFDCIKIWSLIKYIFYFSNRFVFVTSLNQARLHRYYRSREQLVADGRLQAFFKATNSWSISGLRDLSEASCNHEGDFLTGTDRHSSPLKRAFNNKKPARAKCKWSKIQYSLMPSFIKDLDAN